MKKGITTLVGLAVFVVLVAFSTGAPPEATVAPGEQTCGRSSCHNVDANVGSAVLSLELADAPESYEADMTYAVKVALSDTQSDKNGFQIVALDAENNNAGAWTASSADIQERSGNNLSDRNYLTHTGNGNRQNEWSFEWTAPSNDVGEITFYLVSLDANANGTKTGDNLYATSLTLPFATVSGLSSLAEHKISIYPNPTTDYLYLAKNNNPLTQIQIYNTSGKLLQQLQSTTNMIDVSWLSPGLYFLQLHSETTVQTQEFVVQ